MTMLFEVERASGLHWPAENRHGTFGRELGRGLHFHAAESKQDFLALQGNLALASLPMHEKLARMSIHALIKRRREELQLTTAQLAERIGAAEGGAKPITRQTVEHWESGETAPKRARLPHVAQVLGVSVEELLAGALAPPSRASAATPNVEALEHADPVPLISWVRAGAWCEAHEPFRSEDVDQWMPCPVKHGSCTFALRVMGDSMDGPGGYREGEIIFVDPSVEAEPGRDVVVRTPEGAATFKRLKEDSEGRYLLALNPAFPDRVVRVPDGTVFCGVVIGSFTPR